MKALTELPAWIRWPLYAFAGIFLLTLVQSISDTERLTQVATSRQMLRFAVPIFLAGFGGLFSERSGVINIGLEGMLILGMWFGAWGSIEFGPWWGLLIGMIGGGIGGLLHAIATVGFGVDHIISGVAINILAPAFTRFLSDEVWASPTTSPQTQSVGTWDVPFLAGGTIFGWESPDWLLSISMLELWFISDSAQLARGLLRGTHWVSYLVIILVPATSWLIWRTRFGLRLRIAGENPQAGAAQGINIIRYKYVAVVISGVLAGLGGAFISTELSGLFQGGNSAGRGFIGLAALIFGNWRPGGVLVGALLFGYVFGLDLRDLDGTASHALLLVNTIALSGVAVWALQGKRTADAIMAVILGGLSLIWWLSAETVPSWWSDVLPFVLVLLVLVFFAQRLRAPEKLGAPYFKGST